MKKPVKIILIILVVVIVLVIFIAVRKKKTATDTTTQTGTDTNISTDTPAQDIMPLSYAKRSGYKSADEKTLVKALQKALNDDYNANLGIDGKFGPLTEKALSSAGLPTVIYWKQWGEITGKPIWTASGRLIWNKWVKTYLPWTLS